MINFIYNINFGISEKIWQICFTGSKTILLSREVRKAVELIKKNISKQLTISASVAFQERLDSTYTPFKILQL